jgi:hypothetical protein
MDTPLNEGLGGWKEAQRQGEFTDFSHENQIYKSGNFFTSFLKNSFLETHNLQKSLLFGSF